MANQSLLTYGAKVASVEEAYFSPIVTVNGVPLGTTYCFLGRVDPWANNVTPVPTEDQLELKTAFKNMFVAKLIETTNISPVLQRIDWQSGTTYDSYDDTVDMFAVDENGYLLNNFYVRNSYNQVFKCLWNNNNQPSTNMPYFQPGQYQSDNIFYGTDHYKWKFMYTVSTGMSVNFMDTNWIPVPVGSNTANPLQTSAGLGDIEVINVVDGGTGYDPANSPITITVTGDGTGATAEITSVANGVIQDIVVLTPGTNYSYANVIITSAAGSGAVAVAPTSPVGGHGFDNPAELGSRNVMFTCTFNGSEYYNGTVMVPTNIEYYQMGLVINPTTNSLFPNPANGSIYQTTTNLIVAQGFGTYVSDEIVYQGASLSQATFSGTIVSFDTSNNVIGVINTIGTPITNSPVFGNTSGTTRTLLSSSTPDFVPGSGYIVYLENLDGIQRSADGIEQFKVVLGF